MKVPEQAAFVLLGIVDSAVRALTNALSSVAEVTGDLAGFASQDGSEKYHDRAKETV
ncbi:MAG: hypothetical protein HGB19_07255 [Chlorobiales bacterium]|nr:hypothetical protein [Chlorobiales bacterium]